MILNIDAFDSVETEIKKFGTGALILNNQDFLTKGFLLKTSLNESFDEGLPVLFASFWFYYQGDSGKFFSVNENKLNLFLENHVLRVQVSDQIRNVAELEPNNWHLISVKIGTGLNAFWSVSVGDKQITEVVENLDLNYFVTLRAGGNLTTCFDNLIISDFSAKNKQIANVKTNLKLNRFWNKNYTNSQKALMIYVPTSKNEKADCFKIKASCVCENDADFNLQIRSGSRLVSQTAFSKNMIERIVTPQKNIEFCIQGRANNGSVSLSDFQVQVLY